MMNLPPAPTLTDVDKANLIRALQLCQQARDYLGKCTACGIDVSGLQAECEYIAQSAEKMRQQFPELR